MLIVELSYKKPNSINEANKFLEQHRQFLDKYYAEDIFLASGPKEPRDGGVILALTDKHTMESLIKEDPFYQHDIADYKVTEFLPNKYCHQLKDLINST